MCKYYQYIMDTISSGFRPTRSTKTGRCLTRGPDDSESDSVCDKSYFNYGPMVYKQPLIQTNDTPDYFLKTLWVLYSTLIVGGYIYFFKV